MHESLEPPGPAVRQPAKCTAVQPDLAGVTGLMQCDCILRSLGRGHLSCVAPCLADAVCPGCSTSALQAQGLGFRLSAAPTR